MYTHIHVSISTISWGRMVLCGPLRYSIPFAYRLSGQLHVEHLSAAFLALLERHETLRTVLREEGARGDGVNT